MKQFILFIFISLIAIGTMAYFKETGQNSEQTVVILLGPPGSGKGTQATQITKELAIPHISTGDILRENIRKDTPLGREAKKYMDAGKLGPDELVLNMVKERIAQPDCARGYLLDGVPRTLAQAEFLETILNPNAKLVVISLDVSDEAIIKRMAGRLTCKQCGAVYNKFFSPPKQEGVCDKCGGELYQRVDDKEDVVKERLRVYHSQTKPVIQFYERKAFCIRLMVSYPQTRSSN